MPRIIRGIAFWTDRGWSFGALSAVRERCCPPTQLVCICKSGLERRIAEALPACLRDHLEMQTTPLIRHANGILCLTSDKARTDTL